MEKYKKINMLKVVVAGLMIAGALIVAGILHQKVFDIIRSVPAKVTVEVCHEDGIDLSLVKCTDYEDGICINPAMVNRVVVSNGPMHFYFEIESTGVYSLNMVGEDDRHLLVTKRSPWRTEKYGCYKER